MVNFFSRKKLI